MQKLFEEIETTALANEKVSFEKAMEQSNPQLKALQINLERQQIQVRAWEVESNELQKKGEWVYAHFGEVEQLIQALQRAKKQKLNEKKVLHELQKKMREIKSIDFENAEAEIEITLE